MRKSELDAINKELNALQWSPPLLQRIPNPPPVIKRGPSGCICELPDYDGQAKLNGGRDEDCPIHGEKQ